MAIFKKEVIKDLLNGITPAQRQEMDRIAFEKEKEIKEKELEEIRKLREAAQESARKRIYNSEVSRIIAKQVLDTFAQDSWYNNWYAYKTMTPSQCLQHPGVKVQVWYDEVCIFTYFNEPYLRTYPLRFNFKENGYQNLSAYEKDALIEYLHECLTNYLPPDFYLDDFHDSAQNSRCDGVFDGYVYRIPVRTEQSVPLKEW